MSDTPDTPTPAPAEAPTPRAVRRRRRRIGLWIGLVAMTLTLLLVGGALFGVFWAAGSPRGTAWLLANLARTGIGVQVIEPTGALIGDFGAKQVVVTSGRTKVIVDDPVWKGLSVAYTPYPATWARLKATSLHASRVTITVAPSDVHEPSHLPTNLQLPVEIDIGELRAAELLVPGLEDYPLRDVRGIVHMGLDQGRKHHFDQVSVRAEPLVITGHGHIDAVDDLALDVALEAVQADPAGATPGQALPSWAAALRKDWQGSLRAKGPLAGFDTTLSVKGKGQTLDAAAKIEADKPWVLSELDLKTIAFDASAMSSRAPMTSLTGSLRIEPLDAARGAEGGLKFDGSLVNAKPGPWTDRHVPVRSLKVDLRGRARAEGPLDLATFEALLSDGRRDAGVLRASGHWDADRFDVKADLDQVRPSAIDPSLPAMVLTGPIAGSGTWPTAADGARAAIPAFQASAQLNGRLVDLNRAVQVKLEALGDGQRIDVKSFEANAGGAKASLSGHAVRSATAWQVDAKADLADFDPRLWFPGLSSAAWQAGNHSLNLKADAALAVPHTIPADKRLGPLAPVAALRGTANVEVLPSVLAGVPVTGALTLKHATAADAVQVDANLDVDGNKLKADGQIAPDADGARDRWSATAEVPTVARLGPVLRLVPGAVESGLLEALAGNAGASLDVRGRWPAVDVSGQARVGTLRAGPLTLDKADARWAFATRTYAPLDVDVTIDQAGWGTQRTGATHLTLKGTPGNHDLAVRTELKAAPPAWAEGLQQQPQRAPAASTPPRTLVAGTARGSLSGGPLAGNTDVPVSWKGTLQQFDLRSGQPNAAPWVSTRNVGIEVQAGPVPRFVLSPGRADIVSAGLKWERIEWQADQGVRTQQLDMQAELEPLSVAPLLARAQPDFGWGGDLRIGGKVNVRQTTDFSADIVLERLSGDLTVTDDGGTQALGLTDLVLSLNVQDGTWTFTQGLAGKQLGVAAGAFVARTSPQRAWPDADAPLTGVFEAQVENLGTWGAWVPTGWRLGGRLRTTASLGGRFGAPEYTGRMVGNGISVRNVLEGVNVTDGEVDISLKGDSARIEKFSARAGNGTVTLAGDAEFGEQPHASLQLVAEKFQLLGRVDRRIVVSGKGDLVLDRENVKVEGRFGVDEGLIDFTRSDAPALGGDVVVTNRTDNEPVVVPAPTRHRNVSIDLAIDLGRNLKLKGRGIDTGLAGELRITTPNGVPAFNGTIRAENGTYAAYNQKLGIDRGIITFTGPVNDPRLDIEATRPNLDVRVGVSVSGSALNPRVRLFSDPEMSDADKLSWLMLGRASDGLGTQDTALLQRAALALLAGDNPGVTDQVLHSIGLDDLSVRQTDGDSKDTVVSVGKQISRRWYLGYERGLNATQGTWQLIYRVARRFTVRAESGLDNSLEVIWTWRWD